jgi:mono/diheme cytochrome c family protein
MRKERWIATALVVSAVWIGTLAGCGGGEKAPETAQPPGETTPAPTTETPAPAAGEISLAVGEKVVKERCELCHGASGKGDGPGGAALNPKPQDWTNHEYMETRTDDQLYESLFNGKGLGMPAWGKTGILTEAEIRSVIMKVRSFDPAHKS